MSEKDQKFSLIHTPHGQTRPNEESDTKFSFTNFSKEFDDHIDNVDPDWTSDFNLVRASWHHPSPTLTQMGQQGGRGGIHHPDEDRVFTTDELKRLMGLPDDFKLTGTFNQKAERSGRMVTPHLYNHLSRTI